MPAALIIRRQHARMPLFVFGMSIAEALPGQSVANYREPTRQHRVDNQQYDEQRNRKDRFRFVPAALP
jgi:hypothetical protein